jgi:hypothetical protein
MAVLTEEQWMNWKGCFHWMRLHLEFEPIQVVIISKWMDKHINGWWYYERESSGRTLMVFEDTTEMVAFKLWVSGNPFERDHGDVT